MLAAQPPLDPVARPYPAIPRLALTVLLGLLLVFLPAFWLAGSTPSATWRHGAWGLLALAGALLWGRGANDLSPATWLVVLAGYPVAAPLLSLDLVGAPAFAAGARHHQGPEDIVVPVLIGAAATCLLALHLRPERLRPATVTRGAGWPVSGRTALTLLAVSAIGLIGAGFLDAPPELRGLGEVGYREIKASRDESWNFASGLVFFFGAFATYALTLVTGHPDLGARLRLLCGIVYAGLTLLVVLWQIAAASRIEAAGLLLLLYLTFGHRLRQGVRLSIATAVIALLAIVGYVRTLAGALAYLSRDFVSWPAGIENVFNTYAFALHALRTGTIPMQGGQTYLDLVLRLTPRALQPDRPPRAYDLLAEQTRLIGGEYFLTEPFLNAAGLGVLGAVAVAAAIFNAAIKGLSGSPGRSSDLLATILSMVLLAVSFRLFWYGLDHGLKILLLALLLGLPLAALGRSRGQTARADRGGR